MAAALAHPISDRYAPPCAADYSDEDLISAYHAGEKWISMDELFGELFQRHKGRVSNWCYRIAGDREAAADLTQEVFLKAFRNLHNFRGDSKFSTWIYVIARNHCLNASMKTGAQPMQVDTSRAEGVADPGIRDTVSLLEREQERRLMWTTIRDVLNRTEARVMILHYGQEEPLSTVTRQLGLTNPSGAKAYIVSARRKLDAAFRQRRAVALRRQA